MISVEKISADTNSKLKTSAVKLLQDKHTVLISASVCLSVSLYLSR